MVTCVLGQYGTYLGPNQPQDMTETDLFQDARVRVDPRVIAECKRKKPIGVSLTGWLNLLLQRAIAQEPESLARD